MRISDWSSDVCSSDLCSRLQGVRGGSTNRRAHRASLVLGRCDQPLAGDVRSVRESDCVDRPLSTHFLRTAQVYRRRGDRAVVRRELRSEEHTSELQSLMRISYAVFCLKKKTNNNTIS